MPDFINGRHQRIEAPMEAVREHEKTLERNEQHRRDIERQRNEVASVDNIKARKQAVLTKFYGGLRRDYYHKFSIEDGICEYCQVFIGDAHTRICSVVTDEEVALFRPHSATTDEPELRARKDENNMAFLRNQSKQMAIYHNRREQELGGNVESYV